MDKNVFNQIKLIIYAKKTIHLDVYFKNLNDYTTWLNWLQLLIDMVVWND